ncbi:MAG: acetylglutamate kinase [Acidobacteriia bacterium]|nr:acetylglutamate kinase [Terriglobia bacterium]MYK08652.1 acetylglutamate kinase [Terriglobia bacterium]
MKLLVKLGGTLLESDESRSSLARQLTRLRRAGHRLVVVHGGGKRLSRYLAGLDHESEFRRGLRVTPPEIMDAVLRVLAGSVNRQLVAELQGAGARAVGLTGIDAGTVQASQLAPELGLVGKVERVDPELLDTLTDRGFLPAVACIAGGADGAIFNVNADQMAAACATGLAADQVVFLTDVGGVLDRRGETIPKLSASEAESLITEGVAKGGMEAKLRAAVSALTGGIERVSIVNGHEPDILTRALEGVAAGSELSA